MADVAQLVRERFGELTEIQKLAIPRVLAGENVLILAPTGYGKTESALLPILEKIKEAQIARKTKKNKKSELSGREIEGIEKEKIGVSDEEGIEALYITPLRALSRDLKGRFEWWCDRLEISHDMRTGDTTMHERAKHRKSPPKILLTTVESLQALMLGRVMRRHLTKVRFVIVDEIHDILDNKRGAQLSLGLERLNQIASFQRIGISATVANEAEAAKLLFGDREYAVCEAGKNRKMDIEIEKTSEAKMKKLIEENRSLLFVNTRSTAEELGASLRKSGAPIEVHHGSLSKDIRISTETRFKSGELKSILCTSSLELGIDIGDVNLVMQYGSPHQAFRLIQRVGRSGHSLTMTPKGVVFYNDFDDQLESEVIATLAANGWIEDKAVEQGALDVIAHQLVGLCLDMGRMTLAQAHSMLSHSYAYSIDYEKLRMVALQLYSEGLIFYDEDGKDIHIRTTSRARSYFVSYLSTIPKTKRFAMKDVISNKIISSLDEEFVVNLESGVSFFSRGMPWKVIDITETEVLAEPSSALDIVVPSWTGEDIPVSFEVAQGVGKMRRLKKDISPLPDDKTVVIEIVQDLIVIHACFGSKVNESIARLLSRNLTRLIGESVRAVSDPYRVMVKLPYPLAQEHVLRCFNDIRNVRASLQEALIGSTMLKLRFLHVGRMFGLLSEDATISNRFIEAMRYSVVYEETIRSIFSRFFDVGKTEELLGKIRTGKIKLVVDAKDPKTGKPSYFAKIGIERFSGGDTGGAFEPRERMIEAFKENSLVRTLHLVCLNCGATRFMHLAGAPEVISCHNCGKRRYTIADREGKPKGNESEFAAGLISTYGKRALIALSTYGVGPNSADRILRRLHRDENAFYLDIIEVQKLFIKNKKYWKLGS